MGNFFNIGGRLTEERERLGFSQIKFADIGGVGRKSQYNYEMGLSAPDAGYLSAIAVHGADVAYIITGVRSRAVELDDDYVLVTPKQKALLDNLNHCPEEVQDAIGKMALAAKKDDMDVVAKKKKSA